MRITRIVVPIRATLTFVNNNPQIHVEEGEPIFHCQLIDENGFEVLDNDLDQYVIHTANETALTFEVKAVREPLPEDVVDAFF